MFSLRRLVLVSAPPARASLRALAPVRALGSEASSSSDSEAAKAERKPVSRRKKSAFDLAPFDKRPRMPELTLDEARRMAENVSML